MDTRVRNLTYNRELYLELQETVKHMQQKRDDELKRYKRKSWSPPPDRLLDNTNTYLTTHKDTFDRETAAIMASVYGDTQHMTLSRASIHANPSQVMSFTNRLASLARNPMRGVTSFTPTCNC